MSQVLGCVVGDVEELPVLRHHHQEAAHCLRKTAQQSNKRLFPCSILKTYLSMACSNEKAKEKVTRGTPGNYYQCKRVSNRKLAVYSWSCACFHRRGWPKHIYRVAPFVVCGHRDGGCLTIASISTRDAFPSLAHSLQLLLFYFIFIFASVDLVLQLEIIKFAEPIVTFSCVKQKRPVLT